MTVRLSRLASDFSIKTSHWALPRQAHGYIAASFKDIFPNADRNIEKWKSGNSDDPKSINSKGSHVDESCRAKLPK
jgi:hypothetical protein